MIVLDVSNSVLCPSSGECWTVTATDAAAYILPARMLITVTCTSCIIDYSKLETHLRYSELLQVVPRFNCRFESHLNRHWNFFSADT